MGTDLEATIKQIKWQVKYYIECCRPENADEILAAAKEFTSKLKGE